MSDTVLVALASGGISLAVCLINNFFQQSKSNALFSYKMDELSKRVDKHNNLVERTYRLEEMTAVQEEKLKVANHRLDDLERGNG